MAQQSGAAFTRRTVIGIAGGVAASTLLAACTRTGGNTGGGGGGGKGASGGVLKFWNMPWGTPAFLTEDKKIVAGFKQNGFTASYEQIQWANFTTQFATGISSNTGPAVSSGGGTQAFQFAHEGKIQYADDVINGAWSKNGLKDDFLDGLLDTMKTDQGYAAVPYNLDVRPIWYNKTLFGQLGLSVPQTWDDYLNVCKELKTHGIYGFGVGSGAGNNIGFHAITGFMINNGGGWFDENQKPAADTPANEEALEFVMQLVGEGYSDPRAATYTDQNVYTQWQNHKIAMGVDTAGLPQNIGGSVGKEVAVADPLTSKSGQKGFLYFPNNIMMSTNTPSKTANEDFLTYYYQHMAPLWTMQTGIGLPPLKSIKSNEIFSKAKDPDNYKILNTWVPIFKTWAAPGGSGLFYNIANTVDGTQPTYTFAQTVLSGKGGSAKSLLQSFQKTLEGLMQ
jgi:multiple sugar transport system substrate-binding protein